MAVITYPNPILYIGRKSENKSLINFMLMPASFNPSFKLMINVNNKLTSTLPFSFEF